MFFTANQLVAHAVGDYLIQSHWMASEKTKRWFPAWTHVLTYGLPFLLITQSWLALLVIVVTHVVIDHYRLASRVIWLKNHVGSGAGPWSEAKENFGFPKDTPVWMSFWLMVIVDNLLHVLINASAIRWL